MEIATLKDKDVIRDVLVLEAAEAAKIANMLDFAYNYSQSTSPEEKALIKKFISCVGVFVTDRKREMKKRVNKR